MAALDLSADIVDLTAAIVDVPSESHQETALADLCEEALRGYDHLEVERIGDAVVARTSTGASARVILAGHLDTVPAAGNLPSWRDEESLHGLGSCDMKGGVAVALSVTAQAVRPAYDVTLILYPGEEVAERFNGLRMLVEQRPDLMQADLAILLEPSDAGVEAGCQGTLRAQVRTHGRRAHSARSWAGSNAIHAAGEVLDRLRRHEPRRVTIDGLEYREGLNAVGISGGVAGNVIPDECVVTVNLRYAPDRSPEEAEAYVRDVLDGFELEVVDNAGGALPGLATPAARAFIDAVGAEPRPKYGWTDVARFSALGVPALNFGPGDPVLAHTREERVPIEHLRSTRRALGAWLESR